MLLSGPGPHPVEIVDPSKSLSAWIKLVVPCDFGAPTSSDYYILLYIVVLFLLFGPWLFLFPLASFVFQSPYYIYSCPSGIFLTVLSSFIATINRKEPTLVSDPQLHRDDLIQAIRDLAIHPLPRYLLLLLLWSCSLRVFGRRGRKTKVISLHHGSFSTRSLVLRPSGHA